MALHYDTVIRMFCPEVKIPHDQQEPEILNTGYIVLLSILLSFEPRLGK